MSAEGTDSVKTTLLSIDEKSKQILEAANEQHKSARGLKNSLEPVPETDQMSKTLPVGEADAIIQRIYGRLCAAEARIHVTHDIIVHIDGILGVRGDVEPR